MTQVLALADDLTGALEVGAKFAGEGIASVITTDASLECTAPVLVIDTETRHLAPELAAAQVTRVLQQAHKPGVRLIYKKTDSTLRGNIAAELEALAGFYGGRVVYAAGYPAMGRTVTDGRLYVNGVLLEQTGFAQDPLNPITDSRVPAGIFCDVEEDVAAAARRILQAEPPSLAAGTGALAGELAQRMEIQRGGKPPLPRIRSCLIMNGSLHDASARQIEHLGDDADWTADWTIVQWTPQAGRSPMDIADENGRGIRDAIKRASFDAVLVCGGDTAYGMLKAVGFPPIRPLGEVVTGVPISKVAVGGRDVYLITKAGGFGEIDILTQIRKKLHG